MYNFFKKIYILCLGLVLWINNKLKLYFNIILPNLKFFISKRIICDRLPNSNQKTLLTGIGRIFIGNNCIFGYKAGGFHRGGAIELQVRYKNAIIKIGKHVATNNNIFICAANRIEIGDNTRIGHYVTMMDFEAHAIKPIDRSKVGKIGEILIGKNVWIGNNVTILKNSSIGNNTIIATGAVVSGSFPENVVIGGVPAKIIKEI
jgi:acetyltransferase-like isoleucine patch superfamily enzyme